MNLIFLANAKANGDGNTNATVQQVETLTPVFLAVLPHISLFFVVVFGFWAILSALQ